MTSVLVGILVSITLPRRIPKVPTHVTFREQALSGYVSAAGPAVVLLGTAANCRCLDVYIVCQRLTLRPTPDAILSKTGVSTLAPSSISVYIAA